MTRPIPLARPSLDDRELAAVRRVLESGWLVQGAEVAAFEAELAAMHQARHCVVVASGTAALHVALLAMEVKPGDAVFVPSFAWPAAANVAACIGARPVFVDVLPHTYNIDPADLRRQVDRCRRHGWGRPRAVVPVHEFGLAAEMEAVQAVAAADGLEVLEDAACALGATYRGRPVGTIGRAGTFSFHPRKAITTGEGGAIVTNDDRLADACRAWRNHGQAVVAGQREFVRTGLNYRLTEFQAAIGRVQLQKFPAILAERKRIAACYRSLLAGRAGLTLPVDDAEHTWQTFMVVLDDGIDRAGTIARAKAAGVEVGAGSVAGHLARVFAERFGLTPADCPVSARLHAQGLALPVWEGLEGERVALVDRAIRDLGSTSQ